MFPTVTTGANSSWDNYKTPFVEIRSTHAFATQTITNKKAIQFCKQTEMAFYICMNFLRYSNKKALHPEGLKIV